MSQRVGVISLTALTITEPIYKYSHHNNCYHETKLKEWHLWLCLVGPFCGQGAEADPDEDPDLNVQQLISTFQNDELDELDKIIHVWIRIHSQSQTSTEKHSSVMVVVADS